MYLLKTPFRTVFVLPPQFVTEYGWLPENKVCMITLKTMNREKTTYNLTISKHRPWISANVFLGSMTTTPFTMQHNFVHSFLWENFSSSEFTADTP
jgi:hypothetical protein